MVYKFTPTRFTSRVTSNFKFIKVVPKPWMHFCAVHFTGKHQRTPGKDTLVVAVYIWDTRLTLFAGILELPQDDMDDLVRALKPESIVDRQRHIPPTHDNRKPLVDSEEGTYETSISVINQFLMNAAPEEPKGKKR